MSDLATLLHEANKLEENILENNGELSPEVEQLLDQVSSELTTKADNLQFILGRMKTAEEHWKKQADYMAKVSRACKNFQKRLKERIRQAIEQSNKTQVEGSQVVFKLTGGKKRLEVDENLLPQEYKLQLVTWEPDRERIKSALESGQKIPGASLSGGTQLRAYPKK